MITVILVNLLFSTLLLLSGSKSPLFALKWSGVPYVNRQAAYQLLLLAGSALSALIAYLLAPELFLRYLSVGTIDASAGEMSFLGIASGDGWLETGLSMGLIISLITGIFMWLQLRGVKTDFSIWKTGLGWVLLFSLTNSLGEEIIYRLGVVAPLAGKYNADTICLISAILFGLPHYKGMPNGIGGVLMAAFLGFFLAKSMIETSGLFWAWTIHFVQDVIIIGSIMLKQSSTSEKSHTI